MSLSKNSNNGQRKDHEVRYRYHQDEALETIARMIISKYDPSLVYNPAPTPLEEIMEQVYGLTLDFQYIRNNGRVLGETIFEDAMVPIYDKRNKEGYKLIPVKAGTVLIDMSLLNDNYDGRYRFTLAHELSHWVIDKQYFMHLGETAAMTGKVDTSSKVEAILERQADKLASRILMPKCTLKKAFYQVYGKSAAVLVVAGLADKYNVSRQAMGIRLEELGLLSR